MNWSSATALALVVTLAGCAGWSSSTGAQPVHAHGVLVRVGGPAPGAPAALAGVHLRFHGAVGTADVRTGRNGLFALDLAPGTYTVSIVAGGPQSDGRPIQPVPKVVHVPHSGRLRLVVSIR